MRPVFRKRQSAQQVDDITDDLIASIPDLEPQTSAPREAGNPFAPLVQAREAPFPAEEWRPVAAPAPAQPPTAPVYLGPATTGNANGNAHPNPAPEGKPPANPPGRAAPRRAPAPAPAPNPLQSDLVGLVNDVRRQMEAVFSRELSKVEDSFTAALRQMEERLEQANAEAEDLRREKDDLLRVKADYDRKAEALKELARSFDRP